MAKLVWQEGGQQPMAFPLRKERVSVGRDAGNDVRLNENAVSARHAVLILRQGQVMVHDLKSSNGTWVNGSRIDVHHLRHGDTVQFGRVPMRFIDESEAVSLPVSEATEKAPAQITEKSPVKPLKSAPAAPELIPAPHLDADATQTTPPPQGSNAPDLAELDRLVGSIREHRKSEMGQDETKQNEMMAEWKRLLEYAQNLKGKLAGEKRVLFFDVSERRGEIVARIAKPGAQVPHAVTMTWGHPELKGRAGDGMWLRASGERDRRYEKCAEAAKDLLASLAHLLA